MYILKGKRRVRKIYNMYIATSGETRYNVSRKSNLTWYSLCERIKVEMSLKIIITKAEICQNKLVSSYNLRQNPLSIK